jgi:hypothetical protein
MNPLGKNRALPRISAMRTSVKLLCLIACVVSLADPVQAQINTTNTQVTLSCKDGHSVTLNVDQTTLTSLLADVQAINASGTGTTCTLTMSAIDPSSETTEWTVYDYNPSNQAIAPRNSPNSMLATTNGTTTTFPFKAGIYTALLTTTDSSLTRDLSTTTLNDTISVTGGNGTFSYRDGGNCGTPANVRFYFTSPKASGTTCTGTTGFYTQFWWSNPVDVPLATDPQDSLSISQMGNAPSMWSDWNGKHGDGIDSCPQTADAFQEAIRNVQTVGLSFGGGCFFENGVTTSDGGGTFNSMFTETTP